MHKVGSYQTSLVRARKLVILWPAWYVQNSWSSWPTSVRAKKLVLGQLGACIKLVLIKPAWFVQESWLSYDLLGTCKTAGPLDQLRTCKKVGPWPTRCVHKVGSYQTSLVRARKLVILSPAWYGQNSWSSWPTSVRAKKLFPGQLGACIKLVLIKPAWFVQESWLSYDLLGTCKTAGPLDQLRTCKKVGPWPTRCVHKVGSYQTSLVRARSWLSYDLLGTCKTAGPLDQHRTCKKVGPWPTWSVHKVGSYQTSLVRARKLVILSPAWYGQNSWSSWPTSVRAKKLVPGQLGACIKLALIKPAWYMQESWLSYD